MPLMTAFKFERAKIYQGQGQTYKRVSYFYYSSLFREGEIKNYIQHIQNIKQVCQLDRIEYFKFSEL